MTFQVTDDARVLVPSEYVLESQSDNAADGFQVTLDIDPYDSSNTLIIDPVLVYSTYLGGSADEDSVIFQGANGDRLAVDATGNAYYIGSTESADFPTLNPVQGALNGTVDVFVTKLNASGTALVYSTYLGGTGVADIGHGLVIDASGNAYLTGITGSGFPTTVGAFNTVFNGGLTDVFVTKLNPAGNALVYSTYLGGTLQDNGNAIAVDASGNAYVVGGTQVSGFPTTSGAFQETGGNGYVTKLNATGSALVYSTFIGGGAGVTRLFDIVVDGAGNAYVTGRTEQTAIPMVNAFQNTHGGGTDDVLVFKLNSAGSALDYSTYLGGSDTDGGNGIALDASGNIIVVGFTQSGNYPTFNAFQGALSGISDGFITKNRSHPVRCCIAT